MPSIGFGLGVPFSRPLATPHPLLSLFDTDGILIDGLQSRFAVDSAGVTACSASGTDLVGYIEDLSGNGHHFTQATTGNKGLFRSTGGIKSVDIGPLDSAGAPRFLSSACTWSDAYTLVMVYRHKAVSGAGTTNSYMLFGYNNPWETNNGSVVYSEGGGANSVHYMAGLSARGLGPRHVIDAASCAALRIVKSGNGAGGFVGAGDAALPLSWAVNTPDTLNTNGFTHNAMTLGFPETLSSDMGQVAFIFFIKRALSAGELTTVDDYVANFNAWVG